MNTESTLDQLTRRLETLERRQRRTRYGLLGVLAVALLLVPANVERAVAKPGDTITAKKLALLDDAGTVRVLLSAGKTVESGAQVSLFGRAGNPRVILATSGGPKLSLFDPSGTPRVNVATRNDKEPLISIHDKAGKLMGSMTGLREHGGHLMVLDRQGNVRWQSAK